MANTEGNGTLVLHTKGENVARRRPGRPRTGEEPTKDSDRLVVSVEVDRALWDAITRSIDRVEQTTGLKVSRAQVVRSLLKKAIALEEPTPPK